MTDLSHRYTRPSPRLLSSAGFSYVEVLLAIVLIAVSLAPIMEALQSSVNISGGYETSAVDVLALKSKIEETLCEPFASLDAAATAAGSPTTPTIYSDSTPFTTSDGRQITRQVYLWPYDGDNADGDNAPFTGTDAGLLYMKAEIDNTSIFLETLTSQ